MYNRGRVVIIITEGDTNMKTILLAILMTACGDNLPPAAPDAGLPDAGHSFGWRSCSDPYPENGACAAVCCEFEDWGSINVDDAGTLQFVCQTSKRLCSRG